MPRVGLIVMVVALGLAGCGGVRAVPRAPVTMLERADRAVVQWGQALARDVDTIAFEDEVGQISLLYRVLVGVSPRAGSSAGLATLGVLANFATCTIPLFWFFSGLSCDPDPALYLPAGRFGQALASSGVVRVTDDNYVALPLDEVRAAAHRLAVARRRALRDAGAASCRVVAIEAEWQPVALPQDACEVVRKASASAPTQADVDALGLCVGNVLLWNWWSGSVPAVWIARARCDGADAAFAISSDESPDRDLVLFAVVGPRARDVLSLVRRRR